MLGPHTIPPSLRRCLTASLTWGPRGRLRRTDRRKGPSSRSSPELRAGVLLFLHAPRGKVREAPGSEKEKSPSLVPAVTQDFQAPGAE